MIAKKACERGKQKLMEPKTYEKKPNRTNMWRQKQNKQIKFRVFGQRLTHARKSLRAHNQARMWRQDYAYVAYCPKNLKTHKHSRTLKWKSNKLTCIKHEKKYKTNLNKNAPT